MFDGGAVGAGAAEPAAPAHSQTVARAESLALAAAAFAAFLFRLVRIGQESAWIDEYFSREATRMGAFEWTWSHESTPPFFFLLLDGWAAIFGDSNFALRVFSALAGALAVPALYLCSRRWGLARGASAAAAALLFLHPMAYWNAQQNRYYSLLMLLGIVWLWTLPALRGESARRRIEWPFALAGFLCFATHYYFLFFAFGAGAALAAEAAARRSRASLARVVLNFGLLGALMALLAPLMLRQRQLSPAEFLSAPAWSQFAFVFHSMFSVGPWVWIGHWRPPFGWREWLVMTLAAGSALGYAAALASGAGDPARRATLRAGAMAGVIAVISILAAFLFSRTIAPIFIADRYTILFLPPFLMAVAAGWTLWAGRAGLAAAALGLALFAALAFASIRVYWNRYQLFDWRGAIAKVEAGWREGDALVFCPDYLERTWEMNGGPPRAAAPPYDPAPLARAPRVWMFLWEGAPDWTGAPALRELRARLPHRALQSAAGTTLTLIEPGEVP